MDNALSAFTGLPGRTLDQQMRALVTRYGADAVREAAKAATVKRKGRKPEKDWIGLAPWVQKDAEDWLHGRDPMALRSNYSIAKAFAEEHQGHNRYATKHRIERKLRTKRRWYMLVIAQERSETDFPVDVHLRSLWELIEVDSSRHWQSILEYALGKVARYRELIGEPAPDKSLTTIDEELIKASGTILGSWTQPRGLLGVSRGLGMARVQKPALISNPQKP